MDLQFTLADYDPRKISRMCEITGHAAYFGVMIWVITMIERWLASRGL